MSAKSLLNIYVYLRNVRCFIKWRGDKCGINSTVPRIKIIRSDIIIFISELVFSAKVHTKRENKRFAHPPFSCCKYTNDF